MHAPNESVYPAEIVAMTLTDALAVRADRSPRAR